MSRILTALVALPIIIASIWIAPLAPLFVLLIIAALTLGLNEFWMLAAKRDIKPDMGTGFIFAAALIPVFYFPAIDLLPIVIAAFTVASLAAACLRGKAFDRMIATVGATLTGVLYVWLLGGHFIAVRTGFPVPLGAKLLSFLLLVIMGSDIAAYYIGRAFGRHKLAPAISPGKTWEGAAGGVAASLLAACLAHFWFFPELKLTAALPLAAIMNVLGVVGDLTESALKRGSGAKDAAQLLPGHGGILDRLDSLLFNAPVIYYFGRFYFE